MRWLFRRKQQVWFTPEKWQALLIRIRRSQLGAASKRIQLSALFVLTFFPRRRIGDIFNQIHVRIYWWAAVAVCTFVPSAWLFILYKINKKAYFLSNVCARGADESVSLLAACGVLWSAAAGANNNIFITKAAQSFRLSTEIGATTEHVAGAFDPWPFALARSLCGIGPSSLYPAQQQAWNLIQSPTARE
jgi:hypothetical protein